MRRIPLKATVYAVLCAMGVVCLSGCVQPVDLVAFAKDPTVQSMAGSIHLIPGSDTGLAKGNKKITGIDEGKYYIVEEWDEDIMPVATPYQFVSSSGMRSENVSDIGRISGEAIIGLTNYHHYRVKTAQPFPGDVLYTDYPAGINDTITPNPDGIIDLPKPAAYNTVYYLSSPDLDFNDYQIAEIAADGSSKTATRYADGRIMTTVASGTELDYVFYRDISPADPPYEAFVLKVKIEPPIPTDKVIVIFHLNDDTTTIHDTKYVTPGSSLTGDSLTLPAEPIRSGYTFDGWWTGNGVLFLAPFTATTPVSNVPDIMNVYAKWEAGGATLVTVTFNSNGGTTPNTTRTCPENGTVTLPTPNPTRTDYKFVEWNTKADGTGVVFTATTTVTGDMPVFAQWTPCFVVTFDSNGGTAVAPIICTPLDRLPFLPSPEPTRTGYTFDGWWDISPATTPPASGPATGWGTQVTTTAPTFSADTTVYARWKANIIFNSNGGTTPNTTLICDRDGMIILPTTPPTRPGYTFDDWWDISPLTTPPASGTDTGWGTQVTNSTVFNASTTVYARWQAVSTDEAKVGTITFALPTDPASTTTLAGASISALVLNRDPDPEANPPVVNTYNVTASVPAGFTNVRFKVGTHAPAASLVIGYARNGGTPDIDHLLVQGNTLAITVIATYTDGKDYSYVAQVTIVP